MTAIRKEKLLYLESLRGVAAMLVVLFHAEKALAHASPLANHTLARNGYLMVDFFFVLSGFIIAYSSYGRLGDWASALNFQIRRAGRLFPLHIVTLFVALGLELVLLAMDPPNTAPFERNDLSAFLANLFLLQSLTEVEITYNSPSWSISTEFLTYAIFAALVVSMGRWRGALIAASIVIVLSAGAYLARAESLDLVLRPGLVRCLCSFFMGVLVFHAAGFVRIPAGVAPVLLAVASGLLLWRTPGTVPDQVFPPLFALCVLSLVASGPTLLKRVLEWGPLVSLGNLSFGIYLWHTLVFWSVGVAAGALTGRPPLFLPHFHTALSQLPSPTQSLLLILSVTLTVLLARMSFRWVEVPGQAWARRVALRRGQPLAVSVPVGAAAGRSDVIKNESRPTESPPFGEPPPFATCCPDRGNRVIH